MQKGYRWGNSPHDNDRLILAAAIGHIPLIRKLVLKHKADVNYRNASGWDALSIAIRSETFEVVDALLDMGANPNNGVPLNIRILEILRIGQH